MIKNLNIGNIKNIGRGNYEKASVDSTHLIETAMFACTEDDSPIIDYEKASRDPIDLLGNKLLVCDEEPKEKSHCYEKLASLVTDTSIKNSPEYKKLK